jgi:hypothetical protein
MFIALIIVGFFAGVWLQGMGGTVLAMILSVEKAHVW